MGLNKKKSDNYNIGLDIGTSSVGWAVTDDQYQLFSLKKKNALGVRLFDGGNTAEERRGYRSVRRRLNRRKQRLQWLKEIFAPEINPIDPEFFARLNYSWVAHGDQQHQLFNHIVFNDQESEEKFYDKYPTISHLRSAMIHHPEQKFDLRLIYLAFHNLIKYRGNFLYESQGEHLKSSGAQLQALLGELSQDLEAYGLEVDLTDIEGILLDKNLGAAAKVTKAQNQLTYAKADKPKITALLKLLVGNKGDLAPILGIDLAAKDEFTLKFSDSNLDTKLEQVQDILTDTQNALLEKIYQIYNEIVLSKILNGKTYLSDSWVELYEQHHEQLQDLKQMWHQAEPKEARAQRQLYTDYIQNNKMDRDKFYTAVKKFLKDAQPSELAQQALKDIENDNYLLKQRTRDNGAIPYQLHLVELKKIIENQSQYYPFLKDQENKLTSLLSFRVPYYVGPLTDSQRSQFAWMSRKATGKIYPWNFQEKVDLEKSSMKFINRMTATDTYLLGEPVLPKMSLLYQKYEVLNELNKIKLDYRPNWDVELKQRIYNELFKKQKSVSVKSLKKWLVENGYFENDVKVGGLSSETKFNSSLSTYHDFLPIFGADFLDNPDNQVQLEELVVWLTVFEDHHILQLKLQNSPYNYTDEQIRRLSNMRYQGWGRLSHKLLSDLRGQTDESILSLLWTTNQNFMQILHSDKYNFEELIEKANENNNVNKSMLDIINELAGSPAIKRGIWQAFLIVQDIVKVMGHAPEKIFIEFARGALDSQKNKRTVSRYDRLDKVYKAIKKQIQEVQPALVEQLTDNKGRLEDERLYLYFAQLGKSLYSDTPLDINNLQQYEVDHILPQSYIKDNSLENKALVLKSENQHKLDNLLLDDQIINQNQHRWEQMYKWGLMGPKKYFNLTRREIKTGNKKGFINRQLVETRQIIKNVATIFDNYFQNDNTQVVAIKAQTSSELRHKFKLYKNRKINDFHHAHDAYLANIVGTYLLKKYPDLESEIILNNYTKFIDQVKQVMRVETDKRKKELAANSSFLLHDIEDNQALADENGEIIWPADQIQTIRQVLSYKQVNVTRKTEFNHGAFYKETLFAPGAKNGLIAQKQDRDPAIYGGYSSKQFAYSSLVRIDDKKIRLVGIPVYVDKLIQEQKVNLDEWLHDNVKHKKSLQVILTKVQKYQVVWSKEVGRLCLSSATEIQNFQQLGLSSKSYEFLTRTDQKNAVVEAIIKDMDYSFIDIYQEILDLMPQYYPFYSYEYQSLADSFEDFKACDIAKQQQIIEQLLNMLHANALNGNFKDLKFGIIKSTALGKKPNGMDLNNIYLIYTSPTGLFEKRVLIK